MFYLRSRIRKFNPLFLVSATVLALFLSFMQLSQANAMSDGFFTGDNYGGDGTYVLPKNHESNTRAIPNWVNTKSEFIQYLKDHNAVSGQNRTGTAFIVCTMLKSTASQCVSRGYISSASGRTVQPKGWTELTDRLGPITMVNQAKTKYSNFQNSLYDRDTGDNFYYTDTATRTAIDFELANGTLVYRFFRECANPAGGVGLPDVVLENYVLTPTISLNPTGVIEAGSAVEATPWVNNTGDVASKSTEWKITRTPASKNTLPSGNSIFVLGDTRLSKYIDSDTDVAAGTHICYTLSLRAHSNTDAGWVDSAPDCVLVGKRPKVQIRGSDLVVGSVFTDPGGGSVPLANVNTVSSAKNGVVYGSWSEYGIFATGFIRGTASGAAFAGPSIPYDGSTTAACGYSKLSFSNAGNKADCVTNLNSAGGRIGSYSNNRLIPNISNMFSGFGVGVGASGDANVLKPSAGTFIGSRAGDFVLNPAADSTLAPSKTVVLKISGTVTIANDQYNANGPYSAISQIPQLIIIANKIIINSGVTNVDAWLIANGANGIVETCNTGSATYALSGAQRLTTGKCNQKLVVNGPVMAKQLWLRRTAGSNPCVGADCSPSGEPAEIFNLRPDAYMWALSRTTGLGKIQTVNTTELPPRL